MDEQEIGTYFVGDDGIETFRLEKLTSTDDGPFGGTDSEELLRQARQAWDNLHWLRDKRARARDYYWGKQWRDRVEDPDNPGQTITEKELIEREGRIPWRLNNISPVIRNLKGQYRQNQSERQAYGVDHEDDEAAEMVTLALRVERRRNQSKLLEAAGWQEHLLAGAIAFRLGWQHWEEHDEEGLLIQRVNINKFFFNPDLEDPRLLDLRLVGQLHDLTLSDVIVGFAKNEDGSYSREKAQAIQDYYRVHSERHLDYVQSYGFEGQDRITFEYPDNYGLCRVIEVWCRKLVMRQEAHDPATGQVAEVQLTPAEIAAENEARAAMGLPPLVVETRPVQVWHGYYLTPTGEVLYHAESPYEHRSHPYEFGFAEWVDGQTRGIVDDLIDQQRLYNRMVGQIDAMMSSAAKGVLMIPEEMLPRGVKPQDFAESWASYNGVLVYRLGDNPVAGVMPQQVYNNSIPAGAFEWLKTMKSGAEYSSGVHGPVMGEPPKSGTPFAALQQQVHQGQVTTVDWFETYYEVLRRVDLKAVKLIMQYYSADRPLKTLTGNVVRFDPSRVRDLHYDVELGNVADTATARMLFEADLQTFLAQNRLTFMQYLETSANPRAQALKTIIQRTNPLLQSRAQLGQVPPDMQAALMQAAAAGDPDATALLQQAQ